MSDDVSLDETVYVPGAFYCAKCGFSLYQATLSAIDGSIGERDDPGEKCPNDGSPLWRETWKRHAEQLGERCGEQIDRALAAEAERDTLRASLALAREALGVGERFVNACFSAWSCGEPSHRVKTMLDCADEFRAALASIPEDEKQGGRV